MFMDQVSKESYGSAVLGRVGMNQLSSLLVVREGFPEECAFRSCLSVWREDLAKCWSLQADSIAQEKDLGTVVG